MMNLGEITCPYTYMKSIPKRKNNQYKDIFYKLCQMKYLYVNKTTGLERPFTLSIIIQIYLEKNMPCVLYIFFLTQGIVMVFQTLYHLRVYNLSLRNVKKN